MRDLSHDRALLSINSMTVKAWSLQQLIEGCARAGISAISPWRDIVQACGAERAGKLIRAQSMTVTGLCRGGMFPAADEAGRRAALDDNRRAVDEAAAIGAQCLVLVVGGLPKGSRDLNGARSQVREALHALLPYARQARVPLAIEPLHPMYAADRACVNTIEQALDLCEALDPRDGGDGASSPGALAALGVAVDVYHVWWDPKLEAQIARAGRARLHAFHVCDWLVPTRDLLNDRGMMGDGVIEIPRIRAWMESAGFAGYSEVEIFSSEDWWKRPDDEVVATCIERHRSAV
jgi:sugar phosphate isomerase/epimerase